MEETILNYSKIIESNNFQSFDAFYESDEYNKIENEEIKRKLFYYYALKFSSERNKNIQQLYIDLKKITDKIKQNESLQKYDKECYIIIINNYLEKIEMFIAEKTFFRKIEKNKEKENYNYLRDIIKLMNDNFNQKGECPKEIYENLDDLYNILKIKMNHKIPTEYHNRMNRHLDNFKKMLTEIEKNMNYNQEKPNEDNNIENDRDKNYQVNANINNINLNNLNNNSNYQQNNNNINPIAYNVYPIIQNMNAYEQMKYIQNYGYQGLNNNINNNKINQIIPMNTISQNNQNLKESKIVNNDGKLFLDNQVNCNNLYDIKDSNFRFDFIPNESVSYKPENENYVDNIMKMNNNLFQNKNNQNDLNNYNEFNLFQNPNNNDPLENGLKKSKQFTNEKQSINKYSINQNNPSKRK